MRIFIPLILFLLTIGVFVFIFKSKTIDRLIRKSFGETPTPEDLDEQINSAKVEAELRKAESLKSAKKIEREIDKLSKVGKSSTTSGKPGQ